MVFFCVEEKNRAENAQRNGRVPACAEKKTLSSQCFWDESIQCFRGATQIQEARRLSFEASCYGEGAVGVSAPAPPLSFVQADQNAFSGAFLSVGR